MSLSRLRALGFACAALALLALASVPAAIAATADTLTAGCGGGFVAQGWTVTLTRDGTLSRTSYGPGKQSPQTAKVSSARLRTLFKRADGLTADAMPNTGSEVACSLGVAANGEPLLNGRFPYTLGTQAPPPNPTSAERLFLGIVSLADGLFGKFQ